MRQGNVLKKISKSEVEVYRLQRAYGVFCTTQCYHHTDFLLMLVPITPWVASLISYPVAIVPIAQSTWLPQIDVQSILYLSRLCPNSHLQPTAREREGIHLHTNVKQTATLIAMLNTRQSSHLMSELSGD